MGAITALCLMGASWSQAETRPTDSVEPGSAAEKKLTAVIREFPRAFALTDPATDRKTYAVRLTIVLLSLSQRFGVPMQWVGKALPALAKRTINDKNATRMERAAALFLVHEFAQAEQAALDAGDEAHCGQPRRPSVIVEALQLAACAAIVQRHYADAHQYLRVALGETHPDRDLPLWAEVETTRAHLEWLSNRPENRLATLRTILTEHQRLLGCDHVTTLRYHNEYATALYDHSQDDKAELEFRAVLAAIERTADPDDDPAPLQAVRKNLAKVIEAQSRHAEALPLRQAIVETYTQAYGAENVETIYSRFQLATNLMDQDRHAEAIAEFEDLLEIHVRVLGKDDRLTLSTRSALGFALLNQNRNTEAATQFRVAHTAASRVFGPEDETTVRITVGLGICLSELDQGREAEKLLRQAIAIRTREFGPAHPATLEARSDLGIALARQKKWQGAETEYRYVLAERERILGVDHKDTLKVRNSLAILLNSQGYAESALAEHRSIVIRSQKVNGAAHPQTLRARDSLAAALNTAGRSEEAEKEARAVLADHERIEGADHPATLDARTRLGLVLGGLRRHSQAEKELRRVFEARQRISGADDPNANLSRLQLAHSLACLNRAEEALRHALTAYEYLSESYGAEHYCTKFAKELIEALQAPSGPVRQFELTMDVPTTINEPLKLKF